MITGFRAWIFAIIYIFREKLCLCTTNHYEHLLIETTSRLRIEPEFALKDRPNTTNSICFLYIAKYPPAKPIIGRSCFSRRPKAR